MLAKKAVGFAASLMLVAASVFTLARADGGEAAHRPAPLRRLYVAPDGDDGNDGLAQAEALRTISRAAELVQPGDEVVVAGGTYHEYVFIDQGGEPGKPVVFKAAEGETPVVTMGCRPEGWRRVPGTRFVWAAAWDSGPDIVWEARAITRYAAASSVQSLDEMPGGFLFDEEGGRLLVNCLKGLPPETAGIVAVNYPKDEPPRSNRQPFSAGFADYSYAAFFVNAPHVRVEGFTAKFLPTGFLVYDEGAEIRNNVAYGCLRGVLAYQGKGTVVAGNRIFRNDCHGINIGGERPDQRLGRRNVDALVKGNDLRENGPMGPFRHSMLGGHPKNLAIYGSPENATIEGNFAFTIRPEFNWRYKGGFFGKTATRNNVLVGAGGSIGFGEGTDTSFNTVVNGRLRQYGGQRLVLNEENAEKRGARAEGNLYLSGRVDRHRFADPDRMDYRLLADSPHLGRGALPEPAPVRYVSPDGDDGAEGNTPETAWRTLAKAAAAGRHGETVYVMPGEYRESVEIAAEGAEWKTYGRGRVVWTPGDAGYALKVDGGGRFLLDGFIFKGFEDRAVVISGNAEGLIQDCVFDGPGTALVFASSRRGLALRNTFVGCDTALAIPSPAAKVTARNCLFKDVRGNAVQMAEGAELVSEGCAFAGADAEAMQAQMRGLAKETHPSFIAEARFADSDYRLPFASPLAFAGVGHGPVGARSDTEDDSPIVVEGFGVRSVQADRAVLTWYTPDRYPDATVYWTLPDGTTERERAPQLGWQGTLRNTRRFHRLTGLQEGVPVKATLALNDPDGGAVEKELTFTPSAPDREPATLHVSMDGDDANDGLSEQRPLRSIRSAMFAAVPGDTVLVGPGEYHEAVTLHVGGLSPERPFVLKSRTPGAATIHCGGLRPGALDIEGLEHVVVDGFAIDGLWYTSTVRAVSVSNSRDITLRNFRFALASGISCQLMRLIGVQSAVIEDNLFRSGFYNLVMRNCDDVAVRHNTFHWSGVTSLMVSGDAEARYRFVNNIFYDPVPTWKSNAAVWMAPDELPNFVCDYNLYWRERSERMALFGMSPSAHARLSLRCDTFEEVQTAGYEKNGAYADPLFMDVGDGDYRLQPGSPAVGMGEGGATVGIRFGR